MSRTSDAIAAVISKAEEDILGGKNRSEVMSWELQLSGTLKVNDYALTDSSSDLWKECFKKDHQSPEYLEVSFDGQTHTYKRAIAEDRTITVNVHWNSPWDPKNVSLRTKLRLPEFTISVVGVSEDGKTVRCTGEWCAAGKHDLEPRNAKETIVKGLAGGLPWGRDSMEKLTPGDVKHSTLQGDKVSALTAAQRVFRWSQRGKDLNAWSATNLPGGREWFTFSGLILRLKDDEVL